jgi:hypothetical protein
LVIGRKKMVDKKKLIEYYIKSARRDIEFVKTRKTEKSFKFAADLLEDAEDALAAAESVINGEKGI